MSSNENNKKDIKSLKEESSNNFDLNVSPLKCMSQSMRIGVDKFYYSKNTRKIFKNTIFITLFIIIGFLLSFGIAAGTGGYDISFLFKSLFGFGDFINNWLVTVSILGVSGLSFLFAYKSGLFNIGISGQMLGAGLAVVGLSKELTDSGAKLNNGYILLSLLVAMLTGAFIALISGVLKNFFKINEVVSAIMLNWIIFFLAKFFIVGAVGEGAGSLAGANGNSLVIAEELSLYDPNFDSGVVGSFTIFLILAIGIWVLFKFTSYGKKIIAIGKSQSSGVYAGYHTKTLQLSTFVISGMIAGILALIVYTGNTSNRVIPDATTFGNMLPTEGFNGIAISLVSFSHPIVIIPISILFAMVQFANGYPSGLSELMLSVSMYSIAIFVIIYRIQPIIYIKKMLRKKQNKTHFVNLYDEEKNEFNNFMRKKIADRMIDLFLVKEKYKNSKDKSEMNKEIMLINKKYFEEKNEKKSHLIPWYKSIKQEIDLNKGEHS